MKAIDLAGPDPNPMSELEVETLQSIVSSMTVSPLVVIQIVAERGVSTMAILETRPDAFIFSIDIGERPEELANVNSNEMNLDPTKVVRGLGRSQEIGLYWPLGWEADLIFIDGDHRYDGVHADIQIWSKSVKVGGMLRLHDYIHPRDRGPQIIGRVWEAVEDQRTNALYYFDEVLQDDRLISFTRVGVGESHLDTFVSNVAVNDYTQRMGVDA